MVGTNKFRPKKIQIPGNGNKDVKSPASTKSADSPGNMRKGSDDFTVVESDHAPFIGHSATADSAQVPQTPLPLAFGRRSRERVPIGLDIDKDQHDDALNLRHQIQNCRTVANEPTTPTSPKFKAKPKKGRLKPQGSTQSVVGPNASGAGLKRTNTFETAHYERMYGKDGELSELFEPDLVNRTVKHVCYAEEPVFRMEVIGARASWMLIAYVYFLPLASFALDISRVVPEEGYTACYGYVAGRACILAGVMGATFFFVVTNRLLRHSWRWVYEQYYLLLVLLVLVAENAKQLFKLFFEELDLVCENDFHVKDYADLRFLRLLNFAYNYITLQTFQGNMGLGAAAFIAAITLVEFLFLYEFPISERDAFTYNAEQWFETIRIFLLAHKAYLAYMTLSKRSYLRTRSRQLAFWVIVGPLAVECFFRLCGRQLVNLYNILEDKAIVFDSFVGEVCTTELRYIVFAVIFGSPFQRRLETVRIVRLEESCVVHSTPGNTKGEQRLLHRRDNLYARSFGLESVARDAEAILHHKKPSFCLETAIWAFNCSYLVYFDDPDGTSRFKMPVDDLASVDLRVVKFVTHRESSSYGCIFADACKPNRMFVAFRGTASLTDVKTDIKAWAKFVQFGQDEDNKFWVHQGFYSAYKAIGALVRMELHNVIKDLLIGGHAPEEIWVVFCGHSLGGAHATLMAVDTVDQLQATGISNIKLYTFGAPRVGDGQFADFANSRIPEMFRIVGSADPVPRVPGQRTGCLFLCLGLPIILELLSLCTGKKRGVLLFYRHVGYEMVINSNNVGDLIADPLAVEYHFYLSWITRPSDHLFAAYRSGMLSSIFQLKGEDDPRLSQNSRPNPDLPKDTE